MKSRRLAARVFARYCKQLEVSDLWLEIFACPSSLRGRFGARIGDPFVLEPLFQVFDGCKAKLRVTCRANLCGKTQRGLSVMSVDLPVLKKRAPGRDISGLSACEL